MFIICLWSTPITEAGIHKSETNYQYTWRTLPTPSINRYVNPLITTIWHNNSHPKNRCRKRSKSCLVVCSVVWAQKRVIRQSFWRLLTHWPRPLNGKIVTLTLSTWCFRPIVLVSYHQGWLHGIHCGSLMTLTLVITGLIKGIWTVMDNYQWR